MEIQLKFEWWDGPPSATIKKRKEENGNKRDHNDSTNDCANSYICNWEELSKD